ncbi:hypothetical protein UY3_13278 [Chelonia mydas]|uniref:Uncharacterized protein n=1 Tax=Chelonia mydas TaxID=8469 RepID=M7B2D8_CHEMY|nr:hypothetical protein UY3_13278 [Chelonia mydas]
MARARRKAYEIAMERQEQGLSGYVPPTSNRRSTPAQNPAAGLLHGSVTRFAAPQAKPNRAAMDGATLGDNADGHRHVSRGTSTGDMQCPLQRAFGVTFENSSLHQTNTEILTRSLVLRSCGFKKNIQCHKTHNEIVRIGSPGDGPVVTRILACGSRAIPVSAAPQVRFFSSVSAAVARATATAVTEAWEVEVEMALWDCLVHSTPILWEPAQDCSLKHIPPGFGESTTARVRTVNEGAEDSETDQVRVGLIIRLLSGEGLAWASSLLEQSSPLLGQLEEFI